MKNLLFTLIAITIFPFSVFAQNNPIKDYPLREYIAPEIEYRLMDLGTGMSLTGNNGFERNSAENKFNGNLSLHYYEYLNLKNVQRIENTRTYLGFYSSWNKEDSVKSANFHIPVQVNYSTQTRLYDRNNKFWGIHGNIRYNLSSTTRKKTSEKHIKELNHFLKITPYFSFGKGRIQPLESARQAMDILLSLQKYGRLAKTPDRTMIDSLAHVANRIRYKRFFDFRFKVIYQLEELDKALQNMGLVDTVDMIYFANLNDIWNYAQTYKRGTGTRYEGGLIPEFYAYLQKSDDPNIPVESKDQRMNYGIYGFFSFNRMRPVSYAWQSDLMVDLTFGYEKEHDKTERNDDVEKATTGYFRSMLNASWQFGYFPNTRTYAGITPYAGLTFKNTYDSGNTFGVNTGFQFDSYYYISPRLRLSFNASFSFVKDFDNQVPTPFWNSVSYTSQYMSSLRGSNDNIPFPVYGNDYPANRIAYDFSFSLRYALF